MMRSLEIWLTTITDYQVVIQSFNSNNNDRKKTNRRSF
jgi:hypothetical protein